jgi:ectoine hydroxylase-related dioxygenase (phytanoyl-CoA dioxygenase family)
MFACAVRVYVQLWYPIVEELLSTKNGGAPQLLFAGVVDAYPYDRPHAQDWHRDGQALSADPSAQLPPHCINLFIPLVDITEDVGPTEFWPGTHIEATFHALQKEQNVTKTPTPEATADAATATILAPAGSIILFDYRTIHRGGANKSGKQRRVLYLTYATK